MRIATANNYDSTIKVLADRQAQLAQQQERLATGKRVLRASDDPVAAALSEAVQNRLSRVQTDQRALESSRTSIQQAESALGEAGDLVQRVRELVIAGGNAGYGPTERQALAKEIEGLRDQLFAVVNRQNSSGQSLFGGLGGSPTPFVQEFGSGSNEVRFDGQRGQKAAGDNQLPNAMDGVHSKVDRQLIGPAVEAEASLPDAPGPGDHWVAPPADGGRLLLFADQPFHTVETDPRDAPTGFRCERDLQPACPQPVQWAGRQCRRCADGSGGELSPNRQPRARLFIPE